MKEKHGLNKGIGEGREALAGKERVERRPDTPALTLEPHPESRTLERYIMGRLGGENAAHVRVHLSACRDCHSLASLLGEAPDLADATGMQTAEFELLALPRLRPGAGAQAWWQGSKRRDAGRWLARGRYRLALDRGSPDELLVCVREGGDPVRHALVTLDHDVGRPTAPLARGLTNEQGEARLRLLEKQPSAGTRFVVRVLIGE